MMDTKRAVEKLDGRQCYHIIQSFKPGKITPELALEIAKEFAAEYLGDYEVVIGTHVDRHHIHSHLVFNSVNAQTGEKYHVSTQEYYRQIRAISDRLCRDHGLSVIMEGQPTQAVSYVEWLRQRKGQPTFRSMLEEDLRSAIEDANDLGHFFMLMEHKGYEIHHGNRLGFRMRRQERFMYPGRKNPLFTEDGIQAAIYGNMEAIESGKRPAVFYRAPYKPFKRHPQYTGFLALYIHYLYVLGKIEKQQYPPRMTPRLRKEVMRSERYREQFIFLRENGISTQADMAAFQTHTEDTLASLIKQRTILNVQKKRRKKLFDALADIEALSQAKALYEEGLSGMETEFSRYMEAAAVLEQCGVPRERLATEKAKLYEQLAQINHEIRAMRKKLELCREIQDQLPQMEQTIEKIELSALWDNEKQVFVSGETRQVSWASQVWMILAGVLEPEAGAALLRRIAAIPEAEKMVTPYLYHHYVDALLSVGEQDQALDVLRSYWGGMVDQGADTFWELYDPSNPNESPYGGTIVNSFCHAWSCTPAYFLRCRF